GQRRNIAIVDVAGELLVLGLTPTSITLLTRLERAESLERVRRFEEGGEGSFVEVLQERLGLRGGRDGEAGR
ncbi:MAG TPA: hypothetical protein ENJ37_02785, partial [Deltaproteobacteria bacterium]|nr:hypothetical protein [Deltaproteobacteria bacterium]